MKAFSLAQMNLSVLILAFAFGSSLSADTTKESEAEYLSQKWRMLKVPRRQQRDVLQRREDGSDPSRPKNEENWDGLAELKRWKRSQMWRRYVRRTTHFIEKMEAALMEFLRGGSIANSTAWAAILNRAATLRSVRPCDPEFILYESDARMEVALVSSPSATRAMAESYMKSQIFFAKSDFAKVDFATGAKAALREIRKEGIPVRTHPIWRLLFETLNVHGDLDPTSPNWAVDEFRDHFPREDPNPSDEEIVEKMARYYIDANLDSFRQFSAPC